MKENSLDQLVWMFVNKESPEPEKGHRTIDSLSESNCEISGSGHSSIEE